MRTVAGDKAITETRRILRRLRSEGWDERWGKGDHLVLSRGSRTVIVPVARKVLPLGTAPLRRKAGGLAGGSLISSRRPSPYPLAETPVHGSFHGSRRTYRRDIPMYKEEVIQQNSPGTIREAFESVDKSKWKRVSFIDSYDHGYSFDIDDEAAIERFLEANGGFRAVFEPHAFWSPDTVCIDCELLVA